MYELVRIERSKIIQLHTDAFIKNEFNYKIWHLTLINAFNLNSYDRQQKTLLHKAVECGNIGLLTLLVQYYKANINTCDIYGNTPLLSAIKIKHEWIAKFLVYHGAFLNFAQLKLIVQNANENSNCLLTNTFNFILKQIESNNKTINPPRINITLSALHLAIIKKLKVDFVEFLLKMGADPNEMGHLGGRPAHYAVFESNARNTSSLIRCQVNSCKRLNLLKLLLKYKCDFNKPSSCGVIPVNHAISFLNNLDCIEFLFLHTNADSLNIISDFEGTTTLDRLWHRMNNFRLRNVSNSDSFNNLMTIQRDKIKLDALIKCYQSLLKKSIMVGAQFYRYLWKTQWFGYNYYIISNMNFLLRNLLIYQCPYKNMQTKYDTRTLVNFVKHGFEFLIENLTSKFTSLIKRRLDFALNIIKWTSEREKFQLQFLVFKNEFQDFRQGLTQFEENVDLLLKNGNLKPDNISIRDFNRKIIEEIFVSFLRNVHTDNKFALGFKEILKQISNLTESTILNECDEKMTSYKCRENILTYMFIECMNRQNLSLTLQELCRIQVRKSLKKLNENEMMNSLHLSQSLKKFVNYE